MTLWQNLQLLACLVLENDPQQDTKLRRNKWLVSEVTEVEQVKGKKFLVIWEREYLEKWDIGSSISYVKVDILFNIYPVALPGPCPSISLLWGLGLTEDMITHRSFFVLFSPAQAYYIRECRKADLETDLWTDKRNLNLSSSFIHIISVKTFAHILWSLKTKSQARRKWGHGLGKISFHLFLFFSSGLWVLSVS